MEVFLPGGLDPGLDDLEYHAVGTGDVELALAMGELQPEPVMLDRA
ncbi:hypothetical protein Amn_37970 [Aminobacter sp. Y103A]|nr:hypothetical protein [Aminobacter ciceronei]BBD38917.1 hypothetical protein Amn_37970 [Aminobacter sp. SS-2016]